MSDLYVWIPHWGDFQHYRDRTPPWLKTYTELLDDEAYRNLSLSARGVLHGVWLSYAKSRRTLPGHTRELSQRLGQRVFTVHLEALVNAGFIELVASDVLAERLQSASASRAREEKEKEKERDRGVGEKWKTQPHANGRADFARIAGPCPECGTGAGLHVLGCSLAGLVDE